MLVETNEGYYYSPTDKRATLPKGNYKRKNNNGQILWFNEHERLVNDFDEWSELECDYERLLIKNG